MSLSARVLGWLILAGLLLLALPVSVHAEDYSWQIDSQHVTLDLAGHSSGTVGMTYQVDATIKDGHWQEVWIPQSKDGMAIQSICDGKGVSHDYYIDNYTIRITGFDLKPGDRVSIIIISTLPEMLFHSPFPYTGVIVFNPPWWDMTIRTSTIDYVFPPGIDPGRIDINGSEFGVFIPDSNFGNHYARTKENDRVTIRFVRNNLQPNQQFQTMILFPLSAFPSGALSTLELGPPYIDTPDPSNDKGPLYADILVKALGLLVSLAGFVKLALRKRYTSPEVSMDGIGVNQNLDPVEAATLMRADPGRVMTMILFGFMRKGNVKLVSANPLRLEPVSRQGLNYYEKLFMDSIKDGTPDQEGLLDCFKVLAQRVVDKTRPYCRKDTEDYYAKKIDSTWEDVEALDTPELKLEKYDADMLWLMADRNFSAKTKNNLDVTEMHNIRLPAHFHWYTSNYASLFTSSRSSAISSTPAFDPFTAGIESFASSVSDSVESFSSAVVRNTESFIGVRDAANAPPSAISGDSGSPTGGFSCVSCACACAHCACACACAGGGRGCT